MSNCADTRIPPGGSSQITIVRRDINAMLAAPDMESRWRDLGVTRVGGTPDFAAKYFTAETEKWNKVIKASGIKAD